MPRTRNRLTKVRVDEVSLVDVPANQHAAVMLMKAAADAIDGARDVRATLLAKHGDEAADLYDAALAASPERLQKALEDEGGDTALDLSRMAYALGEAMDSIWTNAASEDVRKEMLADCAGDFNDALEALVEKGAPYGGRGGAGAFKTCDDCPTPGGCMKAGKCATETPVGDMMTKAAAPLRAAAEAAQAIEKAAQSFGALNEDREAREKLNRMVWTLQDSVASIMADPEVADKAAMIRESVAEFDAAIAAELGEEEAEAAMGGEDEMMGAEEGAPEGDAEMPMGKSADGEAAARGERAGAPGQDPTEGESMTKGNTGAPAAADGASDIVKSLTARVEAFEKADRDRVALAKAASLLPNGGPVTELAALLNGASPEQVAALETVVKALNAQAEAGSMLFKALGASGDAPEQESAIVKAARARAEGAGAARRVA